MSEGYSANNGMSEGKGLASKVGMENFFVGSWKYMIYLLCVPLALFSVMLTFEPKVEAEAQKTNS